VSGSKTIFSKMNERPKRCNAPALNAPFKPAQAREVRACWISFLFRQRPHSALIVQWTFLSSFEDSHSPARLDATSTDALPAIAFFGASGRRHIFSSQRGI
jgi:hypothetical protein